MRKLFILLVVALTVALLFVSNEQTTAQSLPTPPPSFKFPWDAGQSKKWTLGPHGSIAGSYGTTKGWSQVYALDFGGSFDVLAMQAGRVIHTSSSDCGPNGVILDHGGYWLTEYCHMSKRYAPNGAWIAQGSLIGRSGNLGCGSCGTHLHVAIRYSQNGKFNPVLWDDKVVDGWRIHNVYNLAGKPLYGFGSATWEDSNWGWATGKYFNGSASGNTKFLVGSPGNTRTSSITLQPTSGTYKNQKYTNHWFVSTNRRP